MKKGYKKAMAMSMAFAMMGTTVAFAEDKAENNTAVPISETSEKETVEKAAEAAFTSQTGKVVSVTEQDGSYQVMIDNETGGLRFMISGETVVVDRADGKYLTADKLTEGMEIAVIYGANSPMGMSMPPFLGQVTAVVANADKGSVVVGAFDQELLSQKDMLVLNIGEDTVIQNTLGTKNVLTAEDVKGKNALVFYDITTRSIPAQTNPSFVLILEEKTEDVAKVEDTDLQKVEEIALTTEMVALRDKAEDLGYTVKWQGKNAPVLVEKEEVSIEVTIGQTKYVVDDKEMVASVAAKLIDGVLYVSPEILG